jgi:hypothetical protein
MSLERKTGADYPFTGWWGRPEYGYGCADIELNKNTYDEYLKQLVTLQTMLYLRLVVLKS